MHDGREERAQPGVLAEVEVGRGDGGFEGGVGARAVPPQLHAVGQVFERAGEVGLELSGEEPELPADAGHPRVAAGAGGVDHARP